MQAIRLAPCLAVIVPWCVPCPASAANPEHSIAVSAAADVKVVPDRVLLTVSIRTEDAKSLLTAKAENDNRTRAVLALADKYGIAEKHFLIDSVHMGPFREDIVRMGYQVTRDIEITLDDFNLVEPVLSDALEAGATGVYGIHFATTKHRELQFEARKLAVEHAKEKAGHLAELNGLKLGKALRIEESVEGDTHTGMFSMAGFGGAAVSSPQERPARAKIHLVAAEQPAATKTKKQPTGADRKPVAPGQLTISATVTITFEMKE